MKEKINSELTTRKGLGLQSEKETQRDQIPATGSVIEFTREGAPQLRNPVRSEQRRSIGEGRNPPAAPGSVPIIETDFAELEDGSLAEMIENPKDPANSLFAVYKNGSLSYEPKVLGKNHIFLSGDKITS